MLRRFMAVIAAAIALAAASHAIAAPEFGKGPAPAWVSDIAVDLAALPPEGRTSGGEHYLLADEQTLLAPGGREAFRHFASRALNQRGVESAAHITIDFDPSYQFLRLNMLKVHRDGRVQDRLAVAAAKAKLLQRERDLEYRVYDGSKTLDISLDDVRPGDVVEYAYTVVGANPVFAGDASGSLTQQWGVPVAHMHQRLRAPAATTLQFKFQNNASAPTVQTSGAWTDYTWQARDVAPTLQSSDTPSWWKGYPYVEWTTYADWSAVARWAEPLYATRPVRDPALAGEIARISQSPAEPEERISKVLQSVQSNVRYLGIEMGAGSHAPRPAETVFERRFGDCKDKVMLAVTMLRELGITAYPALVSTRLRGRADEHLAMPTVFNHVVLVARTGKGEWWLDPTRLPQKGKLDRIAQADFGRALVLDGKSSALTAIPQADASIGRKLITMRIDASKGFDVPARMEVTSNYEGASAERIRDDLADMDREELERNYLNYYARDYRGLKRVEPMTVGENVALNGVTTQEHYEVPTLVGQSSSGAPYVYLYARDMKRLLAAPDDSVRSAPLMLKHPEEVEVSVSVVLPDDRAIARSDHTVRDKAFEFTESSWQKDGVLRLQYSYRSLADHVAPADLAVFSENLESARKRVGYSLRPVPATSTTPTWKPAAFVAAVIALTLGAIGWLTFSRRGRALGHVKPSHLLWIFAASSVISGIVEGIFPAHSTANAYVHAIVIAVICYMWCRADALWKDTVPPNGIPLLAALVPPVGLPVYFFKTRPARGALWGISKTIGLVIGVSVLAILSAALGAMLRT